LEAQSASAYQISFKSDDFRLRYSDKTIFKTVSVRHLEFLYGFSPLYPTKLRQGKIFGSILLQPALCVCVSLGDFFRFFLFFCYTRDRL